MILGFEVCKTWNNYALYFLKFSLLRYWAKENVIDMFTADSARAQFAYYLRLFLPFKFIFNGKLTVTVGQD